MIPKVNINLLNIDLDKTIEPSKNHKMDINRELINGYNDLIDGVKQSVFKILNTERYNHYIYSKNYGIELESLFGEPISYVCPEIERRITEALIQDDRIVSVDSFSFELNKKRSVHVTFMVHTIFGDFSSEKEVNF